MSKFYDALTPSARAWVDRTLESLSLDEKLGQLMAPLLNVSWDPSQTREALMARAHRYQVGAVHTCGHLTQAETRADIGKLNAGLTVPALVSADFETSANYPGSVNCGSGMNFGAIADTARADAMAYEAALLAAEQARAMGVSWSFAPVVDIPYNPENPITATRAFAGTPERIADITGSYIRGFQAGGIAATIKHFPGDGLDNRDQHSSTSFNPLPLDAWRVTYGKTFGRGIANGVYAVMVGHIALNAIATRDPISGQLLPASLDPRVLRGLLREEMGFDGVIVSDAIAMGGAIGHTASVAEASVRHLLAGGDMVLFVNEIDAVIAGLKQALADGSYTEAAMNASVRRVLALKATLGLHDGSARTVALADAEAAKPRIRALAQEVAERSVTRVRDRRGILPLSLRAGAKLTICMTPDEPLLSEGISLPDPVVGEAKWPPMARELKGRGYSVVVVSAQKALIAEAADSDAVIIVSDCRPMAGRNSIRLSREGVRCFDWEVINSGKPVVYLNMGNPYTLWEVAAIHCCVSTYSRAEEFQAAAVRAMLGELPFAGVMPVCLDFDEVYAKRLARYAE